MEITFNSLKNQKSKILTELKKQHAIYLTDAGKIKALIIPLPQSRKMEVSKHPLFGYSKNSKETVAQQIKKMRKGRYSDI